MWHRNITTLSYCAEGTNWLHRPYLLAVPTVGRHQSGYITDAFSMSHIGQGFQIAYSTRTVQDPASGGVKMATVV